MNESAFSLPPAMPYEEWLVAVFTPQEDEGGLSWPGDPSAGLPETEVRYLTRLFENCRSDLGLFTDGQVATGLDYLVGIGCTVRALLDDGVPWPERRHGIRAIESLYRDCFMLRCSQDLSHGRGCSGQNPVNRPCYIWWDAFPTWGRPCDPAADEMDAELLQLMERLLDLRHPACRHDACCESVLHGLGHWHMNYPDRTRAIIATFLRQNPHRNPELISYARYAANGGVE